jgi:hypothetical protein
MGMYYDFRLKAKIENFRPYFIDGIGKHEFFNKPHAHVITGGAKIKGQELTVEANLKNYDGEIEAFLDYIKPYLVKTEYPKLIGYFIYEEEYLPTLIYSPTASTEMQILTQKED